VAAVLALGRLAGTVVIDSEWRLIEILISSLGIGSGTKKALPRLTKQVEAVLSVLDTLPFEWPGDEAYGLIRTQLEAAGTPIGGNDMLIAAQAVALDYTLVTDNESEFSRVTGLRIENWLRP
jgi:tRNA(fMet)-specific endonuclease VapC